MLRRILFATLLLASAFAPGQVSYLGLFLAGQRIGYSSSVTGTAPLDGVDRKKTDSKTLIDAGLLGAAMRTEIASTTWYDEKGEALRMTFRVESAGRVQTTLAQFTKDSIELDVDNNGAKTKKTLKRPVDAPVVDDAVNALLDNGSPPVQAYYVLDPMTASLVKNTVKRLGAQQIDVAGVKTNAQVIEVSEPRATMRVFLSSKGDVIRIDGPMGIEMRPISEAEALGAPTQPSGSPPDLAYVTSIKLDKPVANAATLSSLRLRITGADLKRVPSDRFQTVRRDGEAWILNVHPVSIDTKATIATAAKGVPSWVRPGLHIPSDSPEFKERAKEALAGAKTVAQAASRVRKYVHGMMRPNAGIGVLRDASEVLETKEGVCRDYAILTATLLRAGGVPTRLASGLVMMGGAYFYHAWVEVWDGTKWAGVDSTLNSDGVGADHLKLAHGSVEDAFTFTFLDKVKVEVLDVRRE